jgi:hypothetical protein
MNNKTHQEKQRGLFTARGKIKEICTRAKKKTQERKISGGVFD